MFLSVVFVNLSRWAIFGKTACRCLLINVMPGYFRFNFQRKRLILKKADYNLDFLAGLTERPAKTYKEAGRWLTQIH